MQGEKTQLLLVEDDDRLAALLMEYLSLQGFALSRVASGDVGVEQILRTHPDLVILDRRLPDGEGLDVLRCARGGGSRTPFIVLSARGMPEDRVEGLEDARSGPTRSNRDRECVRVFEDTLPARKGWARNPIQGIGFLGRCDSSRARPTTESNAHHNP